jgi:hypothetical protein
MSNLRGTWIMQSRETDEILRRSRREYTEMVPFVEKAESECCLTKTVAQGQIMKYYQIGRVWKWL